MKTSMNSITKHLKAFAYGDRLDPVRDWFVLLSIAMVLLAASVAWNLWAFARVTDGENISGQTPATPVHEVKIDAVQTLFERRAQEEARYLNEYRFVDPSGVGR